MAELLKLFYFKTNSQNIKIIYYLKYDIFIYVLYHKLYKKIVFIFSDFSPQMTEVLIQSSFKNTCTYCPV